MRIFRSLTAMAILTICAGACVAQTTREPGCVAIVQVAALARAKSSAELIALKEKAGDSYRARVIFNARMLEIDPNDQRAAESLLSLTPKDYDDPHEATWIELTELENCKSGGIAESDLDVLWQLRDRLPRDLRKAVLLLPERMFDYVSYAMIATGDPHSDFVYQMQKVCRARHRDFVSAVGRLTPKDHAWFVSKIFNPKGCKIIAFPEAD